MRKIARKILEKTSIEKNKDTKAIVDFIASPDSVARMIAATKAGKPALAGIVKELELRFGNCKGFPLNHDAPDKNAPNRRNIGWFVKYVMAEHGYAPISNSERTRIGADSGSKYFGSAAVYERVEKVPAHEIITQTAEVDRELTREDLWADPESEEYEKIKNSTREIVWKRDYLGLDYDFITKYLNVTGFKSLLSEADVLGIFNGTKIPSEELLDAIIGIFSFCQNFIIKNKRQYHEILGTSTNKALQAFYDCEINADDITDIWVYFSEWDAILDGRYNLISDGKDDEDREIQLDAPRFVIRLKDKTEYWFNGLTCGYAGQGCGGTQEVLLKLGVIEDDGNYVNAEIQIYRCLHYYKDGDKWTYHGEESRYDQNYEPLRGNADVSLFMYNNHLTISQSYRYSYRYNRSLEIEEPGEDWFKASLFFLGDASGIREVELIKVEEPDKRVLRAPSTDPSYQIVLRGMDDREVWLDYPFNDIPDEKRDNLYAFLTELGFTVPREVDNSGLFKVKKNIYGTYNK